MTTHDKRPKLVSLILYAALGILGYNAGKYLATNGFALWPDIGAERVFAIAVAAVYLLIAVFIVVVQLSPKLRLMMMSTSDAEDMAEQPRVYTLQMVSVLTWGLVLLLLALSGAGAVLDSMTGGIAAAILFAIGCWTYWRSMPLLDELYRTATLEAAVIAYCMVLVVTGGWAALAHLGFAAAPAMLTVVTLFWVLAMAATVWAVARRGMLEEG